MECNDNKIDRIENISEKEICEALHKQQVLEYLKGNCQDTRFLSNDYANKILAQCKAPANPIRFVKKLLPYCICAPILFYTILAIFAVFLIVLFPDWFDTDYEGEPSSLSIAKEELADGNYESARAILLDLMEEESPHNGYILPTYAELCQLEGKHDEAATVLIDYLTNVSGTQTVQKGNGLYGKLKELTGPFSPEVESAYENCVAECEESIENFNYLDDLLEHRKYEMALRFCDSLKQENVTDYYLYPYYFTSYTELGKYEECAAYFLSLAETLEQEEETFSESVQDKLNELKPNVSEATQQKIDAAF